MNKSKTDGEVRLGEVRNRIEHPEAGELWWLLINQI